MRVVQHLQLSRFFDASESIVMRCALIIARGKADIGELLMEKPFLDLIGRNEYQGVRWFRGESFQECMYLACLADAIGEGKHLTEKKLDKFKEEMDMWLRKCGDAQYRLDNLLQ